MANKKEKVENNKISEKRKENIIVKKRVSNKKTDQTAVKHPNKIPEKWVKKFIVLQEPVLLLNTTYFLNRNCNRHLILGYSPDNECRPLYILGTASNFVTLSISDWMMLMMSKSQIESWFDNTEDSSEDKTILSKNMKISRYYGPLGGKYIYIENLNCEHINKLVILSEEDFKQCVELDSFLFKYSKQMQVNSVFIDDYYNMYVYYCLSKNINQLSDEDFFPANDLNNTIDAYRLFKEIPIICKDKLKIDLCKSKENEIKENI